jgi:sugar phosphate isomerase/epimerase
MLALQNHNDFITTGEETLEILQKVNSPWLGLMLDIGSFRQGDPYRQIAATAPYAVNWQIKEEVYVNGAAVPADLPRLVKIIRNVGYRGYLPVETLGPGDPKTKVSVFLKVLREALG